MRWPWSKTTDLETPSAPLQVEASSANVQTDSGFSFLADSPKKDFSFYWFFLVFWLTVVATVLISWKMIV
ncbi:hypothetical protein LRY65_03155 [Candidatus Woesebacteria bacterium]|nr:hypothetical protein [Candidatus Woesebacteria bacterium]MCD8507145.1 hypothetical protein [Candidatus Woesebacteria bacterium]MCD8527185.1 hypothetical protein [Candidatus Woesebacteria bacterium]MCD8545960.1 hypothetical protein [Candidatus Woesebacteria bacterium]